MFAWFRRRREAEKRLIEMTRLARKAVWDVRVLCDVSKKGGISGGVRELFERRAAQADEQIDIIAYGHAESPVCPTEVADG